MSRVSAAITRVPTALFLFLLAMGGIVFSIRAGIHLAVPTDLQSHTPFRQMLSGGASSIAGTPSRPQGFRSGLNWEVSQNFPWRIRILESAALFDEIVCWNIPTLRPSYVPFRIRKGFWGRSVYHSPKTLEAAAKRIKILTDFTKQMSFPTLYVNPPRRCGDENHLCWSVFDFESETDRTILTRLEESCVQTFDANQIFRTSGITPSGIFYASDHHLRSDASRRLAIAIAKQLDDLHWIHSFDFDALHENRFSPTYYPQVFLGSFARKATMAVCPPDDFAVPVATVPATFELDVVDKNGVRIVEDGDFSILLDSHIQFGPGPSYSSPSCYSVFARQNPPCTVIRNLSNPQGPRILLFSDSLDNELMLYLACGASEVASIDNREGLLSSFDLLAGRQYDAAVIMYDGFPYERFIASLSENK